MQWWSQNFHQAWMYCKSDQIFIKIFIKFSSKYAAPPARNLEACPGLGTVGSTYGILVHMNIPRQRISERPHSLDHALFTYSLCSEIF
jgi:hypothetical protein